MNLDKYRVLTQKQSENIKIGPGNTPPVLLFLKHIDVIYLG